MARARKRQRGNRRIKSLQNKEEEKEISRPDTKALPSASIKAPVLKYLTKLYNTPGNIGAYGGIDSLWRAVKKDGSAKKHNITRNIVHEFLLTQEAYTTHRQAPRHYQTGTLMVGGIGQLHQTDLADVGRLSKWNDNVKFWLIVIDSFSRFAWVEMMKSKTGAATLAAFKQVYDDPDLLPIRISSDGGREFNNKTVRAYFKENDVEQIFLYANVKAHQAERFIRTLKAMTWRYLTAKHTLRYVDQIQDLVSTYNNRNHSSIARSPASVDHTNAREVFIHLYGDPLVVFAKEGGKSSGKKKMRRGRRANRIRPDFGQKIKYPVGQTVRIALAKSAMEKSYETNFSPEIYKVSQVMDKFNPVQYKLIDLLDKEELEGKFYESELTPAYYESDKIYEIEKILGKKRIGNKLMYLVKWKDWGDVHNSYVAAKDIKDLDIKG